MGSWHDTILELVATDLFSYDNRVLRKSLAVEMDDVIMNWKAGCARVESEFLTYVAQRRVYAIEEGGLLSENAQSKDRLAEAFWYGVKMTDRKYMIIVWEIWADVLSKHFQSRVQEGVAGVSRA